MADSKSKQDYIQEIYRLQYQNNRAVTVTELARKMKVSKPSVSEMVRKLNKAGLVEFDKYKSISLTEIGAAFANKLIRKHRLIELLLSEILDLAGFHRQAHEMEHALSDKAADSLNDFLKNPKLCPDGDPIPSKKAKVTSLGNIPENKKAKVVFASSSDEKTFSRLNSLGIIPGTLVKVIRRIKDGPTMLSVKGSEIALSDDICRQIFVEVE